MQRHAQAKRRASTAWIDVSRALHSSSNTRVRSDMPAKRRNGEKKKKRENTIFTESKIAQQVSAAWKFVTLRKRKFNNNSSHSSRIYIFRTSSRLQVRGVIRGCTSVLRDGKYKRLAKIPIYMQGCKIRPAVNALNPSLPVGLVQKHIEMSHPSNAGHALTKVPIYGNIAELF